MAAFVAPAWRYSIERKSPPVAWMNFLMSLGVRDAAAGTLTVTEASGHVCDFRGGAQFLRADPLVAGNATVARELVALLSAYATDYEGK